MALVEILQLVLTASFALAAHSLWRCARALEALARARLIQQRP